MSFATPLKIREPQFNLGNWVGDVMFSTDAGIEEAREAIAKAIRAGREICRIAPVEFWVDICEKRADEWADYTKVRGNVVWSLARINDILAKADARDSFDRVWELRSTRSLGWLMGAELGEEAIRQAAARGGIDIKGTWQHFADSSSESSVTVAWDHITRESRFGIGN